eukprot:gnl/TRDRNA2_/TRDRNA2_162197_c0_seq1.p2 gnl/TRDRNA2_/TRDRNA2_162197_c0~~gnl/TRDRNA2_/TRDRNA2_162197_c0_seq1.p2  ORF type:complete len:192 (-),score=54.32 gnl/TRDRNA2_/TRDRNA2_162197_c0_seq1:142-717(-)
MMYRSACVLFALAIFSAEAARPAKQESEKAIEVDDPLASEPGLEVRTSNDPIEPHEVVRVPAAPIEAEPEKAKEEAAFAAERATLANTAADVAEDAAEKVPAAQEDAEFAADTAKIADKAAELAEEAAAKAPEESMEAEENEELATEATKLQRRHQKNRWRQRKTKNWPQRRPNLQPRQRRWPRMLQTRPK